jgi:hypothetical protein
MAFISSTPLLVHWGLAACPTSKLGGSNLGSYQFTDEETEKRKEVTAKTLQL